MSNENKEKKSIEGVYKSIRSLIPKSQLKGAVAPKTDKNGLYGIVFRNVDWTKMKSNFDQYASQLKDTDWTISMQLARKDDPDSMSTDKAGRPLKVSFAYMGKDFREVIDIDFAEEDIQL